MKKKRQNIILRIIHNIKHDYESRKNWEMKMATPVKFTIIESPKKDKK